MWGGGGGGMKHVWAEERSIRRGKTCRDFCRENASLLFRSAILHSAGEKLKLLFHGRTNMLCNLHFIAQPQS